MTSKNSIAIGSVVLITAISTAFAAVDRPNCDIPNVNLEIKAELGMINVCLTPEQYSLQKTALVEEYNQNHIENKSYDFDVKQKPLLNAVLDNELKTSNLSVSGLNRQKIKEELLKLLNK